MFKSHKKLQENNNPYKVFKNLDKITLLQEARYFNSSRVNPKKCIHILTKILYLLYQGEPLSVQEATHIFFSTTKLFQSNGIILRRLVYLSLKELSLKSQDVIIVTSSLTKDINGKEDMLRAAAIRTLYTIVDCTMLQGIERYMKKAIVDKNPAVSSAALVSALHQSAMFPELVRCWVKEAQVSSSALNLYYLQFVNNTYSSETDFIFDSQFHRVGYWIWILLYTKPRTTTLCKFLLTRTLVPCQQFLPGAHDVVTP